MTLLYDVESDSRLYTRFEKPSGIRSLKKEDTWTADKHMAANSRTQIRATGEELEGAEIHSPEKELTK